MEQNNKVDELTGLLNGNRFLEDMKQYHEYGCYGYLLILGIDNFKNINMKYGREYGDKVLVHLAETLKANASGNMGYYRLDGDRFAIMFMHGTREDVEAFFEKMQTLMRDYCTISGGSLGCEPDSDTDCSTIFQYAEHTLDMAKSAGKDTLRFFSQEEYQKHLERIRFQEELTKSVQNNMEGFYLHFQPLVDSSTFRIWGVEALLRYRSKARGPLSPAEFIPVLEETELICPSGEWVLRTSAENCRRWRETIPDLHLNVNLSYIQLKQPDFGSRVLEILEETGLPGDALTLEVTESMKLEDMVLFSSLSRRWKKHGITVSIDDFGTGYSNFSYLKSIQVDEVKIDRCFVEHIEDCAHNYRLMHNMIELAHSAGARVCCEGIETEEELKAFNELSADLFQGYLFAMPQSTANFEKLYLREGCAEYRRRLRQEQTFRSMAADSDKKIQDIFNQEIYSAIVEELDEMICVSDMDTYELYYLNSYGRKLTELYDYKGHKCYEALRGKDTPCKNCDGCTREATNFHVRKADNEQLHCHLVIRDKMIPWHGKKARLSVAYKTE